MTLGLDQVFVTSRQFPNHYRTNKKVRTDMDRSSGMAGARDARATVAASRKKVSTGADDAVPLAPPLPIAALL